MTQQHGLGISNRVNAVHMYAGTDCVVLCKLIVCDIECYQLCCDPVLLLEYMQCG